MKDGKIHIKLDESNEREAKAFAILLEAKKTTTLKSYITEAIILLDETRRGRQEAWELLTEEVKRLDEEVQRIRKAIGLKPL